MSRGQSAKFDRLHIGCGPGSQPAGWLHLDGSWNARVAKAPRIRQLLIALGVVPQGAADQQWQDDIFIADLRRALPFPVATFDAVYSSHVLEHLYESEASALLGECLRVLKPGGVLRIVVPDLQAIVRRYAEHRDGTIDGEAPADWLNNALSLRPRDRGKGFLLHRIYSALTEFHTHKWMYDAQSLILRMTRAGLTEVSERALWDSRISDIQQIERSSRLAAGAGVCVEGIKPAAPAPPRS